MKLRTVELTLYLFCVVLPLVAQCIRRIKWKNTHQTRLSLWHKCQIMENLTREVTLIRFDFLKKLWQGQNLHTHISPSIWLNVPRFLTVMTLTFGTLETLKHQRLASMVSCKLVLLTRPQTSVQVYRLMVRISSGEKQNKTWESS